MSKTVTFYKQKQSLEVEKRLIDTGKYDEKSFSNSSLNNIINEMGYGLKKVQKTKPLKKIKETDEDTEKVTKKNLIFRKYKF